WGTGGGTSNNDGFGVNRVPQGLSSASNTARTANGAGGALGADGVNVETKQIYMWFDIPGLDNARLRFGIIPPEFLTQPSEYFSDDVEAIQFDWKADPVAVQVWYARLGDNDPASGGNGGTGSPSSNASHNDAYTARVWFKPTPDWTFSVEGMLWNQQCFARKIQTTNTTAIVPGAAPGAPVTTGATTASTARTGGCLKSDVGDTIWIGG